MASTPSAFGSPTTPRGHSPSGSPRSRSPSATPRSPSAKEALLIAKTIELQERLSPVEVTYGEARRFLTAKKGDVARAARLYERCLAWREEANIDGILDEADAADVDAALSPMYKPLLLDGTDGQGRPVMYANFGRLDVAALSLKGINVPTIARRHIRELERCRRRLVEQAYEAGDPYRPPPVADNGGSSYSRTSRPGHLLIVDVDGGVVGRFMAAWKLWAEIAKLEGNYYPVMMGRCCVIRAPSIANWAFGLCRKSFLDPSTAERISLHSERDPRHALLSVGLSEEMLRQLPKGVIPER